MAYNFRSASSAFNRGLRDVLLQQEVQRRQEFLDGIAAESRARQIAREEAAAQRQAALDAIAAEDRQRRIQREDAEASAAANARGMRQMEVDALRQGANPRDVALQAYGETGEVPSFLADSLKPTPAPKRYQVTVPGPNGQPMTKLVTEDELAGGIAEYREPREPRAPSYKWILRNGTAMHVREEAIQPGDVPYQPSGSGGATEGQRKTEGLLSRAEAARQTIDTIEPNIGAWDTTVPSWAQSQAGQQYGQAARQWIQSVLRDESGAAIGVDEEAAYFRTYFRQPGDSAVVVAQKQRARDAAEQAMRQKVGGSRGSSPSAPTGPKNKPATFGELRRVNGVLARWDGHGWVRAQ
jgi:hypothetical protein